MTNRELRRHLREYADDMHVYAYDPETEKSKMILRVLPPPPSRRGIASYRKLTLAEAKEIRTRYERTLRQEGNEAQIDLMQAYRVSHQVIYSILANKTYTQGVVLLELAKPDRSVKTASIAPKYQSS